MTVQALFAAADREALCQAVVERFRIYNVRCGGVSAIRRILERFDSLETIHSDSVVRLLEVGTAELDVVVFEPGDPEPKSFIMERWAAVLGYEIDGASITKYGEVRCATDVFWEMTFYSESEKERMLGED